MLRTLRFPLAADPLSGGLAVAEGLEAAQEILSQWIVSSPGDYLYFWGYGANLDYNLPMGMAEDQALALGRRAVDQHNWLQSATARILQADDGVLQAVLSYEVEGQSGMVGAQIGG